MYRKYTHMWAQNGRESDKSGQALQRQGRSGQNIGNNHNFTDVSFDLKFCYFV